MRLCDYAQNCAGILNVRLPRRRDQNRTIARLWDAPVSMPRLPHPPRPGGDECVDDSTLAGTVQTYREPRVPALGGAIGARYGHH